MNAPAFRADSGIPGSGIFSSEPDSNAGIYRYDDFDRRFVAERVEQFRDQVARRLAGELTEDQFKPLRLMNGLYLQLHAYMLRIAIPYGTLNSRSCASWPRSRATTTGLRPLHHPPEPPVQLDQAGGRARHPGRAGRGRHARHPDQRQLHPQRHRRPLRRRRRRRDRRSARLCRDHPPVVDRCTRNSSSCRASSRSRSPARRQRPRRDRRSTTSACIAKRERGGRARLRGHVGGGLGRTPIIGTTIREFLPEPALLTYLEAILRVYNRYGRRDNIYKARIKILVHELGVEEFAAEVEAECDATCARPKFDLPHTELAPHPRPLRRRRFETLPASSASFERRKRREPAFARWVDAATSQPHKAPGYAIVDVSLKPIGGIPGRRHRRADGRSSPTSPSATASARSASPTSRTWSCRTSR